MKFIVEERPTYRQYQKEIHIGLAEDTKAKIRTTLKWTAVTGVVLAAIATPTIITRLQASEEE
jgi:hypothetical protein